MSAARRQALQGVLVQGARLVVAIGREIKHGPHVDLNGDRVSDRVGDTASQFGEALTAMFETFERTDK